MLLIVLIELSNIQLRINHWIAFFFEKKIFWDYSFDGVDGVDLLKKKRVLCHDVMIEWEKNLYFNRPILFKLCFISFVNCIENKIKYICKNL